MDVLVCASCGKCFPPPSEVAGGAVQCPYCGQAVQGLPFPLSDPTVTLRCPSPPPGVATAAKPAAAPDAATAPSSRAEPTAGGARPAGGAARPAKLFQFLSPARGPDELGWLGPYRVLQVLGVGGMGVVFRAEDPQLRRLVALKVIAPNLVEVPEARQRFLREARAAAAIEHDHVIAVHQVGEHAGIPFVAMPLLKGESLSARLQRQDVLPVPELIRVGREAARGLEAVHAHGLIHRDIKPANIWLEGPAGRVKILDFGLALSAADEAHLTASGTTVGTPTYMAPEQSGTSGVDLRVDLFSLGCVLYRAATGKMPFRADDETPLPPAFAVADPVPPHTLRPEVPPALSELILRLLARNRQDRPASAREVALALESLERGLPAAGSGAATARGLPRRGRRRPRLLTGVLAAAALVLVAGAVLYVATDHGTLKIETHDPDVKVVVEQDGRLVTVLDARTGKEVRLRSGEYTVRPGDDRKDVEVRPGRVTLRRGTTAVATIAPIEPTAEWAGRVAPLSAVKQIEAVAKRLTELNPNFKGEVHPKIEGGVVTELFFYTDEVTDLSPVRGLPGLKSLEARGSKPGKGRVRDLGPLKGLALTRLVCGYNPISDLTPLRDMPLTTLTFGESDVESLAPLKGMRLTELDFYGNRVSDLTPLRGMALERLNCAHNPIKDLTPLKGMPLKSIYFDFQHDRDTALLRSLKTLVTINNKPAAQFWEEDGR